MGVKAAEETAQTSQRAESVAGRLVPAGYQCRHLGRGSQTIVRALVRALMPKKIRFQFDAETELAGFVDQFIAFLPRHVALVFPVGLRLISWSGFLTCVRPLTLMSPEAGERHLKSLGESPVFLIREAVKGLRSLILLGFYSHPEITRHLDYFPQDWVDQKVAERVSRWGLRVPDLREIAALPGGPEGVTIRGQYDEHLKADSTLVDFRAAWTRASEIEIAAARRAAERAAANLAAQEAAAQMGTGN